MHKHVVVIEKASRQLVCIARDRETAVRCCEQYARDSDSLVFQFFEVEDGRVILTTDGRLHHPTAAEQAAYDALFE